jgi:hypothetical protein
VSFSPLLLLCIYFFCRVPKCNYIITLNSSVSCRLIDRSVMGCCSWNCFSFTAVSNCCYSGEKSKIPFSRMFTSPAKCGACFFAPWYIGLWQALCIVDIIIGPVCVNTADFFITKNNLKPEQCCCITLAGGVEEFDRLHWSLWKWSPLGYFCVPICSDSECGYPVKALDE